MNSSCSIDRLAAALAGQLAPPDEKRLHGHLEECDECSKALEQMAGGAAWSHEAATFLIKDDLDDEVPPREEWSDVDFTVDHLEPAEEPNMLGRLGGYDVLEVIGRGGMGVVLKGYDRELKRCVAIKVLAPHLAQSASAKKRFAREAQAAAAVVHPHVLAIHQVQPLGRLPFLVMPLVAGESLAERLAAQGVLELKEVLRIGMQAAAGLAAAHEQGLVHRDVKPANILLEKGVERAVLTDFGLACAADDVALTRWGIIAGTPQYMSPEQARGEPLDGRSDLFSLGCVFYEMATGVSPFRADSVMATMRRLVDETPVSMASLNPELPHWFIAIVDRLLAKDPSQRFGTAKEVSELLEACLAHIQQPASVAMPAALIKSTAFASAAPPHASRQWWKVIVAVVGVFSIGVIGLFLMSDSETPDISGSWSGDDWGEVVLTKSNDDQYVGTYSQTSTKQTGELSLKWSRIERRFNGQWREGAERFGDLSLRLVRNEIRGAFTTSPKSKINPATPRLADLMWHRDAVAEDLAIQESRDANGNAWRQVAMLDAPFFYVQQLREPLRSNPPNIKIKTDWWQRPFSGLEQREFATRVEIRLPGTLRRDAYWRNQWRVLVVDDSGHEHEAAETPILTKSAGQVLAEHDPTGFALLFNVNKDDVKKVKVLYRAQGGVWRDGEGEGRSPTPLVTDVQRDHRTVRIVHDNLDTHYLLFYDGDFTAKTNNTQDARAMTWTDEGTITINRGKTFAYQRSSTGRNFLRINGRDFQLRQGQLFVLRDDGTVEHLPHIFPLALAKDPSKVAKAIEDHIVTDGKKTETSKFSHVFERVLEFPAENMLPAKWLNLDDGGRVATADFKSNLDEPGALAAWLRTQGADLCAATFVADLDSKLVPGAKESHLFARRGLAALADMGFSSMPVKEHLWDDNNVDAILALRPALMSQTDGESSRQLVPTGQTVTNPDGQLPATFVFQTAERKMGLLQVTAFTKDPIGVKLRYKLLEQAETKSELPSVIAVATYKGDIHVVEEYLGVIGSETPLDKAGYRTMGIRFAVPQTQIQPIESKLKANKPIKADIFERNRKLLGQGTVVNVEKELNPATGALDCWAKVVVAEDAGVFLNMSAEVRLWLDVKQDVTLVPVAATHRTPEGVYVYQIQSDSTVTRRMVQLGTIRDELAEIVSGLPTGELVVLGPFEKIRDGQKVRITPNKEMSLKEPVKDEKQNRPLHAMTFAPIVERILPGSLPCHKNYFQFRGGVKLTVGQGPSSTKEDCDKDWKRAEDAGGVDFMIIALEGGVQVVGEGCIFTQDIRDLKWETITAENVVQEMKRASFTFGVVEPRAKDFPITYLFRTSLGDVGVLQILEMLDDEKEVADERSAKHGMKFRYKLVKQTGEAELGTPAVKSHLRQHGILEAKLQQARTEFALHEMAYKAGTLGGMEYLSAKHQLQIIEAELTGDAIRIAATKVTAARTKLDMAKELHKAGTMSALLLERYKGDVAIAEAELREAEAKPKPTAGETDPSPDGF